MSLIPGDGPGSKKGRVALAPLSLDSDMVGERWGRPSEGTQFKTSCTWYIPMYIYTLNQVYN